MLGPPGGQMVHGIDVVTAHVVKGRGTWAEGGCEPQRFIVVGDHIIAIVHVRVRLKDATEWLEGDTADVFTFRNGKVIHFNTFSTELAARDWVRAQSKGTD